MYPPTLSKDSCSLSARAVFQCAPQRTVSRPGTTVLQYLFIGVAVRKLDHIYGLKIGIWEGLPSKFSFLKLISRKKIAG